MTRALSAFLWLFVFTALAGTAHAADDAPSKSSLNDLLGNASQAVRSENYRGILVYLREGQLDTLRVIHRYSDGLEQERLVSLTGQPREVIRRGGVVTSILPNSEVVLISRHKRESLLGSVAQFSAERMREHYTVSDMGQRRLADRIGRLVRIEPRDAFRYGYRMLIDEQTRLPLKLDLMRDNEVLEQLMFTQIDFPDAIADSEFEPGYDIEGFRVVKHQAVQVEDKPVSEDAWKPTDLPPGFELAEDGVRRVTESGFVRQMLFTDGVATVSAFIAPAGLRKPLEGATTMGAVNAFGHVVEDTQITVVGEVPAVTVEQIARNLVRETKAAETAH
ncbi:MucB/RseB C-terminal domain-containing protein [Endozoicomonas sp. G2_2]|uniref:MucB/RseB C-terminal domain-containing protein n=1 Tax=Endozoicomonas sp. G2_2 TaxID=2821092 RepID=UPI001ADC29E0|nr:MucB/RseB C-terminal domain-containing protein [Endozoicomonas sp. G2_2]